MLRCAPPVALALKRIAGQALAADVAAMFPELGMPDGRMIVDLAPRAEPSATGAEDVEFRVALNLGHDARPLARVIQDNIKKPLADEILFGKLKDGGTVRVLLHEKVRDAYMHPQFIADVMKPLRIEDIIDQEVQNLSGGELQRVAIVQVLPKGTYK